MRKESSFAAADLLPTIENCNNVECNDQRLTYPSQNIHPILPRYQHDLKTNHMSHDELSSLLRAKTSLNSLIYCKKQESLLKLINASIAVVP